MGLFSNIKRGIGQVPTNAPRRGGMGGVFGNLRQQIQQQLLQQQQPGMEQQLLQQQQPGMAINPYLNQQIAGPMDPSGTFQMGFGNMVPDAQTLEQLQQGIPPMAPQPLFEQGVPGPKINRFTGQPVVFDPSAPSAFQTPPQELLPRELEQQKFEQDMAQQLLPPPPGFTPPTIGNPDGSGRDMGIAPPSFGGGRPPLAPPAMQQPVAPLAPPPLVPQGPQPIPFVPQAPQPIPMLPNETSVPFLPPMAPPKRNDFMSIAQDPNQRLNEDVVGDDFNRRQPILRAPDQGRPERFSVNQLNPPQNRDGIRPQTAIEASAPINSTPDRSAFLADIIGDGLVTEPGSMNISTPLVGGVQGNGLQGTQVSNPNNLLNSSTNNQQFGGLDPRAIEADPEGFAASMAGAQQQEMNMPGSTFLSSMGGQPNPSDLFGNAAPAVTAPPVFTPPNNPFERAPGDMGRPGNDRFSVDQQNPFEPEPTMFTPPQNPVTAPTPPAAPAPFVPPVVAPPVPVTPPQSTAAATNTPAPGMGGIPGEPEPINFGQPPVNPVTAPAPAPVTAPAPAPATTTPAPTAPATTTTTTPGTTMAQPQSPFVSNLVRNETGMDATTKQLLFGLDGQGGFIPGAMQAAENTFFNADGTPRVVNEQVAGLSPDQLAAQQLNRQSVGIQDPYLGQAQDAYSIGIGQLGQGLDAAQQRGQQALDTTLGGLGQGARLATDATSGLAGQLGDVEGIQRSAADRFQDQTAGVGVGAIGATDQFGNRLGESESLLRGTTGAYDPSMTQQFYDPYEDAVVDQVSKDLFKQYDKGDIAARASDISRGGESAFGSRARLGAGERAEALGRGMAEAIGGIRSRGFQQAQQTGLSEFARQRQAERSAASGLSGLAGSRLGAQQQLGGTLRGLSGDQLAAQQNLSSGLGNLAGQRYQAGTNLGSTLAGYGSQAGSAFNTMGGLQGSIGQQQQQAMFGLGSNLQGLGQQAQGAAGTDIGNLYNMGQGQQAQYQAQLDAARRNALTAQQAPLAQYQALAPFIQMAPQGQFSTQTTFGQRPSAMQAGLSTGLGALGALGNFMRPQT